MAEASLDVKVVGPEGSLYKGQAGFVAAPGLDGEIGILPGHTALVAVLGIGELRICHGSLHGEVVERFAVRGGFLQVMGNHVTLLVAEAVRPEAVDAGALAKEREEVLAALRHPGSDEEFASLLDQRRWVGARGLT